MRRIAAAAFCVFSVALYHKRDQLADSTLDRLSQINQRHRSRYLPKRIILIRHGESEGNVDHNLYKTVPDNCIELTKNGSEQAQEAGEKIKEIIGDGTLEVYISPFQRTMQTSRLILDSLSPEQIIRVGIEPRLREQEFGNFQEPAEMLEIKKDREKVGRFWYRFPHGESGADVYHRVAAFWTEFCNTYLRRPYPRVENALLVTHGLTMRFFLSAVFRWSPDTIETVWNPENCEIWVLEYDPKCHDYVLSNLGTYPKSSRKVLVHFKDGTSRECVISDYLSLPQPRTEHPIPALQRLGIDPNLVESIDWWNGKYKSNFAFHDNLPGSISRKQVPQEPL